MFLVLYGVVFWLFGHDSNNNDKQETYHNTQKQKHNTKNT